ncbi:uncharacterized protein LOC142592575 [Dermacentor variabilis]|uniref:uncharacterized protein LOC142592575 n=1 Tax=Dermacentor variabilis TaxID=34621 RepID=UPI003F5ADF34
MLKCILCGGNHLSTGSCKARTPQPRRPTGLNSKTAVPTAKDFPPLVSHQDCQRASTKSTSTPLISLREEKEEKTRWQKLGGTGIVDATRRVLKDLFSDHVAMHYSWQGGKGKRHFRETACCEVMLDVLTSRTTCDGTVAEIEKVTKSWLRHAKERMERKTVKHPDNGRTNDEAALPTDLGEASIIEETSHRLLDIRSGQ